MSVTDELFKTLQSKRKPNKGAKATEKRIVISTMEALNRLKQCVCMKHHGTVYATAGHSDLYGVYKGRSFFIEMKVPGEKPRANQYNFLKKMREAGAIADWATSVNEAVTIITGHSPQKELPDVKAG